MRDFTDCGTAPVFMRRALHHREGRRVKSWRLTTRN